MSNDNRGGEGRPDTRTLIASNYPLILHYARRLAPWAAEDVAQDACVLAMQWENYKPGKPVRNWLYWCVMSARAKHEYARRRAGLLLGDVEMDADMPVQPNQEHAAELALLRGRLGELYPLEYAAMAGMLAGLESKEIANDNGVAPNTIRKHKNRARQALGLAA